MGFKQAVRTALSKYFTVTGRATRSEFWWFFLFYILAMFASFLVIVVLTASDNDEQAVGWMALLLFALIPPFLTVTIRRLHDKGLTGWVVLLMVVPFGQLAILILCALPGDEGANPYGPDPLDRLPPERDYIPSNIPPVKDDD